MVARMSSETSKSLKPRINRDIMLYSEAPDIPLSVTATWRFDKAEIIGRSVFTFYSWNSSTS